ncbi:MAG: glycosyltransferase family 39 protein [Chloroflexota bacterium]
MGNRLVVLALVLLLSRFATQTYARMITNSNSAEGDQSAFLQLGLDLRQHGVLTDGTRNPLYPVFLAMIARREWSYFTWAKLLSLAFGLLAILATYLAGRSYFNRFTGLVAAYLLSINTEFIVHSATALVESLLVLTFVLAWWAMLRALDAPANLRLGVMAGGLAGLAYLAKGSGQLLVLAFGLSVLLFYRFRLFRLRGWWAFVAAYAIVAGPLWLYNTLHFGSPTFSYPTTHQMWMESWNDWHPDALDDLPTAAGYLQTHPLSEIVAREWVGIKALRNILIKTLWPTRTLAVDRFLLSPLSAYTLALAALLPLLFWRQSRRYIQQQRSAVTLTVLVTVIFYLLFAWYVQIVSLGQRFLLPVMPLLFLLPAHLLSLIWGALAAYGVWPKRILTLVTVGILAYQGYWAWQTSREPARILFTHNVFEQDRQFNADAAMPLEWLAGGSARPGGVAWGPGENSLPAWAYSDRLDFQRYPPDAETLADLTRNFSERGVEFIIVTPDVVSRYPQALARYFPADGSRLAVAGLPPGWALTYAYRSLPCEWCIFRLLAGRPPQHQANYQLGEGIRLVGYDLDRTESIPGDTLHLTLHWQAAANNQVDYTVFTQLLGPDLRLHGQLDHPPLDNLWPTGRWQPGERLADRYDLPIDPAAPPGDYQLLVGMYEAQSGQRLAITLDGKPVSDNAIRLATISLRNYSPPSP